MLVDILVGGRRTDIETLTMSPCTNQYVDQHFFTSDAFRIVQSSIDSIESAFCIDDPHRIQLIGNSLTGHRKRLKIDISRCDSKKKVCKGEDEIEDFINDLVMVLFNND